jgi:hypothetical protein
LRIKEHETCLTLQEHDDDDDVLILNQWVNVGYLHGFMVKKLIKSGRYQENIEEK